MNTILIEINYEVYDNEVRRRGEFRVNSRLYAQYPDLEASKVAKQWVKEINREHGNTIKVTKLTYEGKDITHLVAGNETNEPDLQF
jgi:hypothetical protein